ncbi:MAG: hypothetical protein L3J49_13580 [Desulfobulbaceae bacterium]|nr:hypothetical protein [Desulfobulbaceae bacterium]
MLVYPKIAHEVMSYQAIFMVGCGCDVKSPESTLCSAYLVQPCWFITEYFFKSGEYGHHWCPHLLAGNNSKNRRRHDRVEKLPHFSCR